LVEVRRDLGNAAQRIADERIIRSSPVLAVSEDHSNVYVTASFSPNSFYRLDATEPSLPVVAEDQRDLNGAINISLSPDGTLLYTAAGLVVNAWSIRQITTVQPGVILPSADGSQIYVARNASSLYQADLNTVQIYETGGFSMTGKISMPCEVNYGARMVEAGAGNVLMLSDDKLCISRVRDY
jgi:DNA-binding beta-propeller fold protein YncE